MNDSSYAFRFLLLLNMYSIWQSNLNGAIKGSKGDIFVPSVTIYKNVRVFRFILVLDMYSI